MKTVRVIGDPGMNTHKIRSTRDYLTVVSGNMSVGNNSKIGDIRFPFITGEEDNKEIAASLDNLYLGRAGYKQDINTFFLSHLTETEVASLEKTLIDAYKVRKPKLVVSHRGPSEAVHEMFNVVDLSPQAALMDKLFQIHQPQNWVFSHWRKDGFVRINRTNFVCLDSMSEFVVGV